MKQTLIALAAIFLVVASSDADIYRYVDADGVVSYTDIPLNKNSVKIAGSERPVSNKKETLSKPQTKEFHSIVNEKANQYDIDPSLVHAVIKTESNGNPHAVSRKGAMGLMQLMPTTARDLEVRNPFDPEDNIDGGVRYLKYLLEKFKGDLTLALAAYNAGPKRVEQTGTVPQISETKSYIKKVLSLYNGKTYLPVASGSYISTKSEPIYKVLTDDGTVLFTNSPLYRKNPRL